MRMLAFLLVVCTLAACESTLLRHNPVKRVSQEGTYREGERQVANVGDYMTSTVKFMVWKAADSASPVVGSAKHKGKKWEFTAPAGAYLLAAQSTQGSYYLSSERLRFNRNEEAWGGLFVPTGMTAATEIVWSWQPWSSYGARAFGLYAVPLASPAELKPRPPILEPVEASFVATLSYAGVATGQIRFVYKEFSRSDSSEDELLARPAFTQEVSLDYKSGQTYGYKNARFVVHEAGPTHIAYTLLSHL